MFAKQYNSKDEFELYGALVGDLTENEIPTTGCRVFCYAKTAGAVWNLLETLDTLHNNECAEFFVARKETYFQIVLGPRGEEITFHGQQLSILSKYKNQRLQILDFEDLVPDQNVIDFDKRELRESVAFFKKIMSED